MDSEMTYEKAIEMIDALIRKIEDANADLEKVGDDVKKAAELIAWCRGELAKNEEEIAKTLKD
ncbi:MAG: exodeoxyribonuclease VII small subunit [Bacteroidales bacterium]|nr:exodeoxyribonuclease VII small subunit [Bacteroidales bacterium]